MTFGLDTELMVLWAGLLLYVAAGMTAVFGLLMKRCWTVVVLGLLVAALILHGLSIVMRWYRLEHGPFITLFEILSSNIWSLLFVFSLVYWKIPQIRPSAALVLPVMFTMMGWLLITNPGEGFFPPTYDTIWLYIHIGFGKIFLGAVIVAVGLSGVILLRRTSADNWFVRMPSDPSLEELAFRFMGVGLVFDTLMLVTGAIWAQDAWGRYWSWDPLETWAFITWLLLATAIHLRITFRPGPTWAAIMVLAVFVVAFLTFFGVPFVSTTAHKGAV